MIPRYGEPIRRSVRYRERQGAYALIVEGDRMLLTHQAWPRPEFQLPGGGINPGESPLAALHREAAEETGWTIRIDRRLGAYRWYVYIPEQDMWARKTCRIYLARPIRQTGLPAEEEHTAIWTSPELAASLLASDGERQMVRRHVLVH